MQLIMFPVMKYPTYNISNYENMYVGRVKDKYDDV